MLDLSDCENEPIHLIGSIQPHGALLAMSVNDLKVLQCSSNVQDIIGLDASRVLAMTAAQLLSEASLGRLRKCLSDHNGGDFQPPVACSIEFKNSVQRCQGLFHVRNGVAILELEAWHEADLQDLTKVQNLILVDFPYLFQQTNLVGLFERTVQEIHKLTDFDRVLIYRFDEQWHGTVVAEQRRPFMTSYMNQKFPASDIPAQARELYSKNLLRLLVDVNATDAAITPPLNPQDNRALDLSQCILRGMSQVHLQYLKNMEVQASMSISLMVKGKLWGLIACHHRGPKVVDFAVRSACEFVSKIVSGLIERLEENEIDRQRLELQQARDALLINLSKSDDVIIALSDQLGDLMVDMGASGVALVGEQRCDLQGVTPEISVVGEIVSWLSNHGQPVFYSDKLSLEYSQWNQISAIASGLLAVNISLKKEMWLIWFRPEQSNEIQWAGNPHKPVEKVGNSLTLHPRKSFELWIERVQGQSAPWRPVEVESAQAFRRDVLELLLAQAIRREKSDELLRQQREDMLAMLAHDLQIPVLGISQVLAHIREHQSEQLPKPLLETLQLVEKTNLKQLQRIRTLLQVFAYELNLIELQIGVVDCDAIVRESLRELVPLPGLSGTSVDLKIKQENNSFRSDPDSIRRIVDNLLNNALNATKNEGSIEITCLVALDGLHLEVTDSGPGIKLEDQAHLFNRFWQGGTAKYSPGVGMGLCLCKRIVDLLGGVISCESTPGHGSTFRVFLPSK